MTRTILTCSPHFVDLALNELRRYHPEVTVLRHVTPGYMFLEVSCPFGKLAQPWRSHLPIYLHHMFPVHHVLALDAALNNLEELKQLVQFIAPPDAAIQLRTTNEAEAPCLKLEIQRCLIEAHGVSCQPTGRILSVLIAPEGDHLQAYLGISWATQNLSPWAGGQLPVSEAVPNRAGFKLLEALTAFGIRLRRGDHALDLGAAPGAWTTLLRQRGMCVTAVAPTPLYPWLISDPDVVYKPLLAEEYLRQCNTTFDLIVNDMKLDAQDSARLMVDYAQHLRSEGIAIMTLKLRERNKQRIMDHAFRLLRKAYKIIRVRQLVSNRKEVTLFLRRKLGNGE